MNRRRLLAGAAAIGVAGLASPAPPVPPATPRRPVRIDQFGQVRIDDYAWLKPANWREVWRDPAALPPPIAAHLQAENRYCQAVLAPSLPLRAALASRIAVLTALNCEEPPRIEDGWAYFSRLAPGARQASYWRRRSSGGPQTLLLDVDARGAGHGFFRVIGAVPSSDGTLFAWAQDTTGAEKYEIFIKVLATGRIVAGPADAFGDFVISPDGRWLYWIWRSPESRPARLYRRRVLGGADVLLYEETDPAYLLGVSLSGSKRFIFVRSWNDVTSEVRIIDAASPGAAPSLVERRREGVLYSLEHWRGRFAVLTNADGAADFKLMLAPTSSPGKAHWREWARCEPGRTIVEMRAFARHFVRLDRVEGNVSIVVADASGVFGAPAGFDEAAYLVRPAPSDFDSGRLVFSYESPVTPRRWMACDLATGERSIVSRSGSGAALDPRDYVLRRLSAPSSDGVQVPITVLHRAGAALDGQAPLMLTGYGAYGACYEMAFAPENLALVDRGWAWAVAHVRGGSEKGAAWFEAARGLGKKKSFVDFIACAHTLARRGYTTEGRIAAFGYSAGGLLVGAALDMRPELFGAAVGRAPFVDVLGTMSDPGQPLVPLTRPVWGDPLASRADYDNIASYSPCQNVARRPYPPVLATTAVADDRVGFWEPAEWIALLRAQSTSGAPMLLRTQMSGGHAGVGGGGEAGELARMYAFTVCAVEGRFR